MSGLRPFHRQAAQHERYKRKQSESFLSQPEHTIWVSRHRTLRSQYLYLGVFFLKAVWNSCKLQRLLQVNKFLFMYSLTHTNIVYLFKHLPTKIFIFKNVCYQMKCFSGDSVSFFGSRFCYYFTDFFDFMWSSNKIFKDIKIFWTVHSRPFFRFQGKNLDWFWIRCCFQFFLYCLVQPDHDTHFLFHVILVIRIRPWFIQTVNLYFLYFWNIAL